MENAYVPIRARVFPKPYRPIAPHLPDEIILRILDFFPADRQEAQKVLYNFCLVKRQWYNIGVHMLYEAPYLESGYSLFVRTVCPSILAHIKKSSLAGLVQVLDLSHITYQSSKSTTARLLNRTKPNLHTFIAPQASFAINCWAALSKCTSLRKLDLSLVSEGISYELLLQTVSKLPNLTALALPRASQQHGGSANEKAPTKPLAFPRRLAFLQIAGKVQKRLTEDIIRQPDILPPTLTHISFSHCPSLERRAIRDLLLLVSANLKTLSFRQLPHIGFGHLNHVLDWAPNVTHLTIPADYISQDFGDMPDFWNPSMWHRSKALECITLLSEGSDALYVPPNAADDDDERFSAMDMCLLIDARYLGRLRRVNLGYNLYWREERFEPEVEGVLDEMIALDQENWKMRRWHYAQFHDQFGDLEYDDWVKTKKGKMIKPDLRLLRC